MADYLTRKETKMSIDERKWLLKCRIEDIDIISNRNWNNEDIRCNRCPTEDFTQRHLLYCKGLQGKNKIVSQIPEYEQLFGGDMNIQIHISRIMKEHYTMMKLQKTM